MATNKQTTKESTTINKLSKERRLLKAKNKKTSNKNPRVRLTKDSRVIFISSTHLTPP